MGDWVELRRVIQDNKYFYGMGQSFTKWMFVSQQQRRTALGTFTSQAQRKFYAAMTEMFKHMGIPTSGDWLYSMQERHQAYSDYKLPFYNPVTPQRKIIYIQPFDEFDKEFLDQLSKFCEAFYLTLTVKTLPPIIIKEGLADITTRSEPILQFQKENGKVTKRDPYYGTQYLAQDFLAFMEKRVPKDAYCVLGVTLKDIYAGKNWNYVYGWAKYVARVGIFSFLRWDQEYALEKKQEISWKMILYPSLRVMIHEIGHMFGVTHCVYYECLMSGFMDIDQNYRRPFEYCPICLRKLAKNIGFDLRKRYKGLIQMSASLQTEHSEKDIDFYSKLLQVCQK